MTDGARPAPIIVAAVIGAGDFAWLDGLRRRHFPPERNVLPAHLTLFHHLPRSALDELRRLIAIEAAAPPPDARIARPILLGRGVAFAIDSPGLRAIRERLADRFRGQLVPQDAAGWRPHVTIQNKVEPEVARVLLREIEAGFRPRSFAIEGLAAFHYRGGPWEQIFARRFRR